LKSKLGYNKRILFAGSLSIYSLHFATSKIDCATVNPIETPESNKLFELMPVS
jgi:hypothetical protein